MPLSADDQQFLDEAAAYLEGASFLIRIANLVGKPAEVVLSVLPKQAHALISQATHQGLEIALDAAVSSLANQEQTRMGRWASLAGPRTHTAMTALTGAAGGLLGLPGAAAEWPITMTLILRSIAQTAASNGFDLQDPEIKMQCLAVFSYGPSPHGTDGTNDIETGGTLGAMESSYLTMRLTMAKEVEVAAKFIATHTAEGVARALKNGHAPALLSLINRIAAKFQIEVTEKLAAQAIPIVGAATGSLINAAFTDHFNRVAKFHFGIVRLERIHGREAVQVAYREACVRAKRKRA